MPVDRVEFVALTARGEDGYGSRRTPDTFLGRDEQAIRPLLPPIDEDLAGSPSWPLHMLEPEEPESLSSLEHELATKPGEPKLSSPEPSDWIVTGIEVREDETIILTGNLIIKPGGSLTLINCTLMIDCSYDGEWQILVEETGIMNILEDSKITAHDPEYEFLFYVCGRLVMRDSFLSECGYDQDHPGLWLKTRESATLENTTITNCYRGICCWGSSDINIMKCTISNNGEDGISCLHSSDINIVECTISNNEDYGIYCLYSSDINIAGCTISNNDYAGICCWGSSDINIVGCTIGDNNGYDGIDCGEGSSAINIMQCTISGNGGAGIDCWGSSDINIVECTISGNGWGIACDEYSSNIIIYYCDIYSNRWHGLYNHGRHVMNATYCWWGSPDGPEYKEEGDPEDPEEVYSKHGPEYLLYDPWLTGPVKPPPPPGKGKLLPPEEVGLLAHQQLINNIIMFLDTLAPGYGAYLFVALSVALIVGAIIMVLWRGGRGENHGHICLLEFKPGPVT